MIIYLDDALFPPSKSVLAAAKSANAVQIISTPWPVQYSGLKSGVHIIDDPVIDTKQTMRDQPVTWGQLHAILASTSDLTSATSMIDTIAQGSSFPAVIIANNIKEI